LQRSRFEAFVNAALLRAVIVAWFCGCAPVSSFRPASGIMPGKTLEFGMGGTALSPRPYVEEDWQYVGAVWVSSEATATSDLSAIMALDDDALAIGGAYRLYYVDHDRFAGAAEAELGFAWGAFSLPVSFRLLDQTHVYVSPRIGTWGLEPIFGVPAGLSVRIYEGVVIRGEWQVSWQNFMYYNRRDHWGFAGAYQF
jgi:hypothetical protein